MTPRSIRFFIALIPSALMLGANPTRALADDAARISRLESEIQLLRTQIDAQHRRILRLEDELSRHSGSKPVPAVPEARESRTLNMATDPLPWHSPASWGRVKQGMSEAEVTNVLGEPTHRDSMEQFKTLFYDGQSVDSRPIRGHVNFRDGRVVAVNKPKFDDS
jgi:hypothetical protein